MTMMCIAVVSPSATLHSEQRRQAHKSRQLEGGRGCGGARLLAGHGGAAATSSNDNCATPPAPVERRVSEAFMRTFQPCAVRHEAPLENDPQLPCHRSIHTCRRGEEQQRKILGMRLSIALCPPHAGCDHNRARPPVGHFSSARSFRAKIVSVGSTSNNIGVASSGPSSFTVAGMPAADSACPGSPPACRARAAQGLRICTLWCTTEERTTSATSDTFSGQTSQT